MLFWEDIEGIETTEEVVTEMLEHYIQDMPNTASELREEAITRGSEDKVLLIIKPMLDKQLTEFWL